MKRTVSKSQPSTTPEKRPRTSDECGSPQDTNAQGPQLAALNPPPQVLTDQVNNFIVQLAAIRPSTEHPVGTESEVDTHRQTPPMQPDVQMAEPAQPTESEQIEWYRSQIESLSTEIQKYDPNYKVKKLPVALDRLVELYYELYGYLSSLQATYASSSAYQGENVEPAQLTESEQIDWYQSAIESLIAEIQKYDPNYKEKKLPVALNRLVELYNELYYYLSSLQSAPTSSSAYSGEQVEGLPYGSITTAQTTQVAVPRSNAAPREIYASLKNYVKFAKKVKEFDLVADFDHTGNNNAKKGPDAIDWARSKATINQLVEGYVMSEYFKEAWKLLTEWNTITTDAEFEIRPDHFKWPPEFNPQASDETSSISTGSTRTFGIKGQQCQLSERKGVKGGYHTIYDVPDNISQQFGSKAIVRAPNSPSPQQDVAKGLENRRKIENMGYTVPKIFNMPDPSKNNDGFYIVEFVEGEFNRRNKEHCRQVKEAFADMLKNGSNFPFDFRIDNVKFKGDTMVVIDFSEGGDGAGEKDFWKDSLIEFCWKRTRTRPDPSATSGSKNLDRLIADAKVEGEGGSRLPSSLGQSPADYDGGLFEEIWKSLPQDAKANILSSLHL